DRLNTPGARATRRRWQDRVLIVIACVLAVASVAALVVRAATSVSTRFCPVTASIDGQEGPLNGDLRTTCYEAAAHQRDDAKTRHLELLVLAVITAGAAGACELSRRRAEADEVSDSPTAATPGEGA